MTDTCKKINHIHNNKKSLFLISFALPSPSPKTQIIPLLISLKCYQLLPPHLRSDHLLPLPALPTAKHRTIPTTPNRHLLPQNRSPSLDHPPPTCNLYNPETAAPHLPWVSSSPWPINYVGIKPVETGPNLHSFPPFESGVKVETERGGVISLLSSHNIPDNLSEIGVEYVEVGI